MRRRRFLLGFVVLVGLVGCRGRQTAQLKSPYEPDMVGSHTAGAETYKPLVDTAVSNLLARHAGGVHPAGFAEGRTGPLRICFVGVENKSAEELGDFKEQLYQQIDTRIVQSQVYEPISRRFVEAGLRQTRFRPDDLFIPENMRTFVATMEQMGQPFDYLLFATITSGTTRSNKDYQRDYLLTLELVDVRTGRADKESAEISKEYNVSVMAKLKHLGGR